MRQNHESNGRIFYHVTLGLEERLYLQEMVDSGKGAKEQRKRAHILLLADVDHPGSGYRDAVIADVLYMAAMSAAWPNLDMVALTQRLRTRAGRTKSLWSW